eukprot:4258718-Prymnesium_polylepis.1
MESSMNSRLNPRRNAGCPSSYSSREPSTRSRRATMPRECGLREVAGSRAARAHSRPRSPFDSAPPPG